MERTEQLNHPGKLYAAGKMLVALTCHSLFFMVPLAIVPALPSIAATFTLRGAADGRFLAQLILIVAGLASIVGAPAVSFFAKRIGKRSTLLAMLFIYTLSGAVGIFEPGFLILLISRFVLGFAGGAIGAFGFILLADYYEGALRLRLLGFSSTIQMAVAIFSMILCGLLVDRFGWGSAFAVYLVAGVVILAIAFVCITEPPAVSTHNLPAANHGLVRALAPVYPIYVLITVFAIGQFLVPVQGPFLLVSVGVIKASSQGMIAAVPNVAAMISAAFFGVLHARISERRMVVSITVAMGAIIIATALMYNVPAIVVCYFVMGIASGIMVPVGAAMVIARASPGTREVALGIIFSVIGLAQFLNPLVAAPLYAISGVRGTFAGIGMMVLIMGATITLGSFGRRTSMSQRGPDPVRDKIA
jgi:DHA1 family bicyclomycin/chloramphenicol resistance-like MFS transporter